MAKQFKVAEDASYTCETAAHFWLLHVLARWEKFLKAVKDKGSTPDSVEVTPKFPRDRLRPIRRLTSALSSVCPYRGPRPDIQQVLFWRMLAMKAIQGI